MKPCSMSHLGGCGILGVGVWLSVTQGNFATLSTSLPSLSAANLLIAVGTIIMVIGCLGCVGAVKESRPLLISASIKELQEVSKIRHLEASQAEYLSQFFILLLLIFLLEILFIILFFAYQDREHCAEHAEMGLGLLVQVYGEVDPTALKDIL
ncbi:tetraspanin-4 isoform X2 [Silurus meridionalis]|nr:tetraspanin-4 isoform X2 [Silurus meridionalis]